MGMGDGQRGGRGQQCRSWARVEVAQTIAARTAAPAEHGASPPAPALTPPRALPPTSPPSTPPPLPPTHPLQPGFFSERRPLFAVDPADGSLMNTGGRLGHRGRRRERAVRRALGRGLLGAWTQQL
jgi:hypothetical protein